MLIIGNIFHFFFDFFVFSNYNDSQQWNYSEPLLQFWKHNWDGGDFLVKETIEAVESAETQAIRIKQDAEQEAARILQEAKQEVENILNSSRQEADSQADASLLEAKKQAEKILAQSEEEAKKISEKLRASAQANRAAAVKEIFRLITEK